MLSYFRFFTRQVYVGKTTRRSLFESIFDLDELVYICKKNVCFNLDFSTFQFFDYNTKNGWWSKPTKDNENLTEYLYLGKVEKNLFNRFIQHLGLGHKMTSSLKLCQWFNKLDAVDLEFQFLELNKEEVDYLEDIENILWRKLKPLIGAEPRIK